MAERTLSTTRFDFGAFHRQLRYLLIASMTGAMAGMGSFMFINSQFMPFGLTDQWGIVIIAVAGVYTHFLAADLTESVTVALLAFVVGIAVHVAIAVAPLWILDYPPVARDVLLPQTVGRAIAGNIFVYFMSFWGSYFGAVMVGGYLDA